MSPRRPQENGDAIYIHELELAARVGVPEEERAKPQRLTLSVTIWPVDGFRELQDQLAKTVNYSAVCRAVREFVSGRSDRLIETLGEEIAEHLLVAFPAQRVRLELRKFIVPGVKYVAVTLEREKPAER